MVSSVDGKLGGAEKAEKARSVSGVFLVNDATGGRRRGTTTGLKIGSDGSDSSDTTYY